MENTIIKLGIRERIGLIKMLPPNESRAGYKLVRAIAQKVDIFQAEAEEIDLRRNQKTWLFNTEIASDKDFEFTDEELDLISKSAKNMDVNGWVTDENFDIVDLILENYPPAEPEPDNRPLPEV
jgi:hypothetical protein